MNNNAVPNASHNQSERVSDAVMEALQLRAQPFTDDPSDGDWFVDDTTRDQLQVIRTALVTGDDLLLISGEEGSGKTVLLKQFSSSSGARLQCMSVRGSEHFITQDLFSGLLKVFKLKPPLEMPDILKEVIPCLQAWTERNTLGVIVLDDADAVPDHEITTLLESMRYLNGGGEVLLKILLSAKPDFEPQIPTLLPPGSDLPYSALAMESLDANRSRDYLEFRLNQAGNFDKAPFSDRETQSIFEASGGLPARLNQAAAAELNIKHDVNNALTREPSAASPLQNKKVKFLLGALGLGLIGAGLYQFLPKNDDDPDSYTVVAERPVNTTEEPDSIAMLNENESTVSAELTATDEVTTPADTTTPEVNGASDEENLTSDADAETQTSASETNTDTEQLNPPANSQTTDTEQSPSASTESDNATNADAPQSTAPTDNSTTEAASSTATETSPAESEDEKPADATASTADAGAADSDEAEKADTEEPSPDKVGDIESANWILLQKPNQFTVQLSSSTDLESIKAFLKRTGLDSPNSIFSYKQGNVTRYALVHGLFPTTQAASAAIEKMDPFARRDQPWIRSVRQLQNALKK